MADKVEVRTGGVFFPLLTVLFIGLKLTGHIAWPWVWVLSPIWIPAAFAVVIVLACLAVVLVTGAQK